MMFWSPDWRWDSDLEEDGSGDESCQVLEPAELPFVPPEDPHFLIHILAGRFDGCISPRSVDMDASLWSKLPQEVLETILAVLPSATRFRFQAVCKRWRSFISSKAFLVRSAAVTQPNSMPVIGSIEYRPGHAGRRRRPHSDISRLFSGCMDVRGTKVKLTFLPKKFQLFTEYVTQDGLACIIKPAQRRALARTVKACKDTESKLPGMSSISLCVVNPITRTWQEVPPEFGPDDIYNRDWTVKLVVDRSPTTGYKVIVMSHRAFQGNTRDRRLTASIYCSQIKSWKLISLDWGLTNEYNPHWPRHLLCNGLMYTARNFNHFVVHRLEDGKVVRRFTEADSNAQAEDRYDDMGDVCELLEHCGDMFCVAESLARDNMRFEIWKLEEATLLWDKVSVMPDSLTSDLEAGIEMDDAEREEAIKYFLIDALVVGDSICLTIGVKVQHVRDWFHTHLVAYHIWEESWQLICCGLEYDFHGIPYTIFTPTFNVLSDD